MAGGESEQEKAGISVRISSLLWADILVLYAFFVMQNYLTDVWGLSFTHAAGIVNVYGGACLILPVFFLWLVDASLGNFLMLVISSIAYSVGIGLVAMSTPPVFGPCKQYESNCIGHTQKVVFYIGMPLVAIGVAGHQVSLKPFNKEQGIKMSGTPLLKILATVIVVIIPIVGAIALPHIKPWSVRLGLPAICTVFSTFIFLICSCSFKKSRGQGSPMTNVLRVFVAFAHNMFKKLPLDDGKYYKKDVKEYFKPTRCLRCLHKAAIDINPDHRNCWKVCSVAEVEEAKTAVRMIPMWLAFIICGIVSSTGTTFFVEQANHMNRKLGTWDVPAPMLLLFYVTIKGAFEKKLVVPYLSKEDKHRPPLGIAVAMILSIICCIVAAVIERRRLNVMRSIGLSHELVKEIPFSVFWLLFQYFFQAGLDAFLGKSVAAFYDSQSPENMEEYPRYFAKWVSGVGYMSNVLLVYIVGRVKPNWFQFPINGSRLDNYYWLLAALSAANLLYFAFVAYIYQYKSRKDRPGDGKGTEVIDDGDGCACF